MLGQTKALLQVEAICVTYQKWFSPPKEALKAVSLTVGAGEVVCLLGPNGAGKSTLMRAACGLVWPRAGRVTVQGEEPGRSAAARHAIGAVLESERWMIWQLSGRENLDYFAALRGMTDRRQRLIRIDECLEIVGLRDASRRPVGEYSRGMKQRMALAGALLTNPTLLLFDEPTLGLDLEGQSLIRELLTRLAAAGCGVLLATHQLELAARYAHRIAFLREGRLITDRPVRAVLAQFAPTGFAIVVRGECTTALTDHLNNLGCTLLPPEGEHWTIQCPPQIAADPYPLLAWLGARGLALVRAGEHVPDLELVYQRILQEDEAWSGGASPLPNSGVAG